MPLPIHTVGHSTRTLPEFTALLISAGVQRIVDVRSFPHSRRHPHFNIETLPADLARAGVAYTHIRALGGPRAEAPHDGVSPNAGWTHSAFRGFADYALTEDFRAGLHQLLALSERERCAIMCSEAVWWRCHRRIITDYLLIRGASVFHILSAAKIEPASMTPFAAPRSDGAILYPRPAPSPMTDSDPMLWPDTEPM